MLFLAHDIELSPGPSYPCGSCGCEVTANDNAIECDECVHWFHIHCQNVSINRYNQLAACDQSFSWVCSICDQQNYFSSSLKSRSSYSSVLMHRYKMIWQDWQLTTENEQRQIQQNIKVTHKTKKSNQLTSTKFKIINVNANLLLINSQNFTFSWRRKSRIL